MTVEIILKSEHPRWEEWLRKARKYSDDWGFKDSEPAYALIWLLKEEYEAGYEAGMADGREAAVEDYRTEIDSYGL